MRTVLVVGATGILAPAVAELRARGDRVIGVSRYGSGDEDDATVAVDARDASALADALDGMTWTDALVYEPAVSNASLSLLRSGTPGRIVLVRTTAAADPALGVLIVPRDTVQLGWTAGPAPRWHTPGEASAAALAVLADGEPRTLGTVRPWSDRP